MSIDFDIYSSISSRRSARSYKPDPLQPETLDKIKRFAETLRLPFEHNTEIRFFDANPTKALYSSMTSPKNNIAFLSPTDHISIAKAGFVGELALLMAESLGVASCWYGHYNLAELENLMPHLESPSMLGEANMGYGYSKGVTKGIRAICISPLGYYESKGLRLMDRTMKSIVSYKRKNIIQLLSDSDDYNHLTDDMIYALDLARKAPSALNAQMWRFEFENDYKTIKVAMPNGYRHIKWEHPNVDIGICASHLWLGLLERGLNPQCEVFENNSRAILKFSID